MSPEQLHQLIVDGVLSGRVLAFTYGGHTRAVVAALYGTIGGRDAIVAYQFGGASASGAVPAWRHFYSDKLEEIEFSDTAAPVLPAFSLDRPHFDEIFVAAALKII